MNLSSAVSSLTAGAMYLTLALQNGFKALYFVAIGLSFLAGVINLLDYFKARHSDDESGKGDPD
ncbi:hypothetical protein OBV_45460 [Oscillibacter valericigenes Sjm18-20]|nr:hypothetical protein OBV_45460 [Oscillibacter valericigenes Sjm18-20]